MAGRFLNRTWAGPRARALRLSAARDRSQAGTERTAPSRAGFSCRRTAEAVEWCQRLGYVDDARFARNWTEYRLLHSPSGRRRLEAELRQKGVDAHIVDASAVRAAAARGGAAAMCGSRSRQSPALHANLTEVRRRRLTSFLARRGFDADAVRTALTQVDTDSDTD